MILFIGINEDYIEGPAYFIEYARTYVFLHDFTYEMHVKRTGWQPCQY